MTPATQLPHSIYSAAYTPTYQPHAFVARENAYQYISQHITLDAPDTAAALIGARQMGKSATLWHFVDVFDGHTIGVYLRLVPNPPHTLLADITQAIVQATSEQFIYPLEIDGIDFTAHLEQVIRRLRPTHQLVLLLDDLHHLLDTDPEWAANVIKTLHDALQHYADFHIVVSIDESGSQRIGTLAPLVIADDVFRLTPFSLPETLQLVNLAQALPANDLTTEHLHRATGGHPMLLQHISYHYRQREDIQAAIATVRAQDHDFFVAQWEQLNHEEQAILTAVAQLIYQNPLAPVQIAQIERWLASTDMPMPSSGIRATLRQLEYQHWIYHEGRGIRIRGEVVQVWLLHHSGQTTNEKAQPTVDRRGWLITWASILIFVILIGLWTTQRPSRDVAAPILEPQPTVTLVPADS